MDLLDLVLLYDCNLKCSYCTITDAMRVGRQVTPRQAAQEIDAAAERGCRALSLTGGEPTLRRDLLGLVRRARARGFTDIKIQTNGLLFAEPANLARAVDAGVTQFGVSVHEYSPIDIDSYERGVRALGVEPMLLCAIDNLIAAPVELTVDMIMMRSTMASLFEAMVALAERGVMVFNLWLVSLTDNNADALDSLPTLTSIMPVVKRCLEYGRSHGVDVRSLHVPRCFLAGYEGHVHHPGVGKLVRVVTPESVFELSASQLSGGVKPERCSRCCYDAVCPGLRADYVDRHGDEEVRPVS
ncbi:MAG: molybdenum cofactor biosynthesis enzyme MoaA [Myxococcota bacterium]|jgi:molybdenum cofactor biosynthesis enzyme MoaA